MKKFAALLTIMTATALASPMALAKTSGKIAAPKAHVAHAAKKAPLAPNTSKVRTPKAKRQTPPRGPNGRFMKRSQQ